MLLQNQQAVLGAKSKIAGSVSTPINGCHEQGLLRSKSSTSTAFTVLGLHRVPTAHLKSNFYMAGARPIACRSSRIISCDPENKSRGIRRYPIMSW